jgi:hypothetical protein
VSTPRCRIVAYPGPRPSISLAFELENAGAGDWAGEVLEPIVPFDLRAWIDGQEVRVSKPALDIGARDRVVHLPPGERIELHSPIVLVFEESRVEDDPFTWTIEAPAPAAVELEASVDTAAGKLPAERTNVTLPPASTAG